jgi:tetratricopeptide (TPR) repeat protein
MRHSTCGLALLLFAMPAFSQDPVTLLRLGGERMQEGRCDDAASLLRRAAGGFEQLSGTPPEQIATVWQSLGSAYRCRRFYAKAIGAYGKAFELGAPRQRSEVLISLGSVYIEMGRYPDARNALSRAEQMLEAMPTADPEAAVALLHNRSSLERHLGHLAEAESLVRRARALLEATPDADPGLLVDVLSNLAALRTVAGDHREAATLCSAVLVISDRAAIPPVTLAAITEFCARELRRIGQRREAKELQAKAKLLRNARAADPASGNVIDASQLRRPK